VIEQWKLGDFDARVKGELILVPVTVTSLDIPGSVDTLLRIAKIFSEDFIYGCFCTDEY
jgi:hypothetical protein